MGIVLLQFSSNESQRSQKFFREKKKRSLAQISVPTEEYHSEMSSYTDYFYLFFLFRFRL